MAHEIHLETNISHVVNKDVTITVKTGSKGKFSKRGTLLISKGNVQWVPAGNSVNKFQASWNELAKMMEENGKVVTM